MLRKDRLPHDCRKVLLFLPGNHSRALPGKAVHTAGHSQGLILFPEGPDSIPLHGTEHRLSGLFAGKENRICQRPFQILPFQMPIFLPGRLFWLPA